MEKRYISANELLLDSFRLARLMWDDGYRPNYIIGLWRGGTPPGIAVHEFFRYKGWTDPYHTAIKTQSYKGLEHTGHVELDVKGMNHVIDQVNAEDRLLLIDDVFDTGLTIQYVIQAIRSMARRNCPEICVATVWFKPSKNLTSIKPDYYVRETEDWLVFPHELEGLEAEEVRRKGEEVYEIVFAERGREGAG